MRFVRLWLMVFLPAFCLRALPLSAQLEYLTRDVTDINVFLSCWSTPDNLDDSGSCLDERSGFGIEVLWALSSDSSESPVFLEMGLGYSQFGGFESEDAAYELRGTVRDLPAVSLYATWTGLPGVRPYAGLRTGYITLRNVQAYDRFNPPDDTIGTVYSATADALQLGPLIGLGLGWGRVYLTGEVAYLRRRLPSIQWAAGSNTRIPASLPRELDFSGLSFALGLQVQVRDPK